MKKLLYFFVFILANSLFGQDYKSSVNTYLNANKSELGLESQDYDDLVIDRYSYSKSMDVENVYAIQRYQGIELFNSVSSFAIRNGQVLNAGFSFKKNISEKVNTTSPSISAATAINNAAQNLGLTMPSNIELIENVSDNKFIFSDGGISLENIPVKLVFQTMEDNSLRLAWDLSIYLLDASHYYSVRIDAVNGALLDTVDWVVSCSVEKGMFSNHTHIKDDSRLFSQTTNEMAVSGGAQYRVFAMPIESPNHGVDTLEADPSGEGQGSPFGWHDTNGAPGAEYTITRGNNVWSQDDINGNNSPDGISADGGPDLIFDFPYIFDAPPIEMVEASTVNLFYWNNLMHDIYYQYGFDEASGNFQENNYGNGGNGSDSVNADAQDGGGSNNANFATPPDGSNPRMQMFLWDGAVTSGPLLTINDGPLAGDYDGIPAAFGGEIVDLTEDLVLVEDDATGTSDTNDACDPITNGGDLTGKIAVIRRGECEFGFKSLAAQNEGAVAVIMVNNVDGDAITMAGGAVGDQVTIPLFMVNNIDGEAIIEELLIASINASINGVTIGPEIDGDLDNAIIAHEYGHGISNRLTGGANNTNCLNNAEQMGEGWSDYVGLMLTMEPGDQGSDIRGIGTYATGQPVDAQGIREAPYSTDFAVNNYTYADSNNNVSQPHGIGFVWATMLWDMTWLLIDEYGFDTDLYNGTGGNNIAIQLVMDGMKLQSCSPGFVDGRDAILEADELANDGANRCLIWDAFSNRGLGYSADQGNSFNRADQVEAFDLPPVCDELGINDSNLENNFIIYPNPSNGNVNIQPLLDFGIGTIVIYDMNGREVYNKNTSLQNTVSLSVENLTTGLYIIQINGADYNHTAKLVIKK